MRTGQVILRRTPPIAAMVMEPSRTTSELGSASRVPERPAIVAAFRLRLRIDRVDQLVDGVLVIHCPGSVRCNTPFAHSC